MKSYKRCVYCGKKNAALEDVEIRERRLDQLQNANNGMFKTLKVVEQENIALSEQNEILRKDRDFYELQWQTQNLLIQSLLKEREEYLGEYVVAHGNSK